MFFCPHSQGAVRSNVGSGWRPLKLTTPLTQSRFHRWPTNRGQTGFQRLNIFLRREVQEGVDPFFYDSGEIRCNDKPDEMCRTEYWIAPLHPGVRCCSAVVRCAARDAEDARGDPRKRVFKYINAENNMRNPPEG